MAEVKRTLIAASNMKKPSLLLGKKPIVAAVASVQLPIELSEPVHDLGQYHLLFHGEKKIGKTTLTTVEKGTFLLTFDPFQKALKILQAHVSDWNGFMQYLVALEEAARKGKYPYKKVVVDGVDIWYNACQAWACKKLVIEHPSDEDWGKGWDLLKRTFSDAVDRLLALPGGCWFISHSAWREVETRVAKVKVTKLLPLMRGGAEEILVGRVDGWFAYDYAEDERIIIVRGDERTGAGNRIRGHFMTPDARPIFEVPAGNDEFEAWDNLNRAFNNQQAFATIEERDEGLQPKKVVAVRQPLLVPKGAIAKKPLLRK